MIDSRRSTAIAVGLIAAIVVIAYLRPLLFGDTFVLRDHLTLNLPSRAHLATSLRAGDIPEWWDGVGLGVPFASNPLNGVTYAPTWLVAVLPIGLGADVLVILHVLLLGIGVALLSRRLGADTRGSVVAAGVIMCAGYTASMVMNGLPLFALAWMPWVAWAADRVARQPSLRTGLTLAALASAQLMVGDPAAMITAGWLALLFIVVRAEQRRRALVVLIASFAAAVVLAAVALLPALLWSHETQRGAGMALEDAGVWSLHPLRMLEWVWPNAFGEPETPRNLARVVANTGADEYMGSGWSLSVFVGAPTLLFAVAGALRPPMRARGLLFGSLVFVVLALGTFTPLYGAYRALALPEQLVRYPERHLAGALVVWSALAGAGFTSLFGVERDRRRWWKPAAAMLAVLALLITAGAFAGSAVEQAAGKRIDGRGAWTAMMRGGVAAVIVASTVLIAIALRERSRYRELAPRLAAVALIGHLVAHSWSLLPLVPRSDVDERPAVLAPVQIGQPVRQRLYQDPSILRHHPNASPPEIAVNLYAAAVANTATRFGFAYVPGYDPVGSARLRSVWDMGARSRNGERLLDLFGVELRVARDAEGATTLLQRRSLRPRAFVSSRWVWIGDGDTEALYASLFGDPFDLQQIRIAGTGSNSASGAPGLGPCDMVIYEGERVRMRCSSSGPGYAVLLDAWAPGWTATVDGRPTPIERADGVVRAVPVNAGTHDVELRYRTPGLRLGALISLLAWLGLVIGALVLRARHVVTRP